ncbi:MAG TPA: hypothetical protein VGD89_00855 [Flavipsychrobacter sp.]
MFFLAEAMLYNTSKIIDAKTTKYGHEYFNLNMLIPRSGIKDTT